MSALAEPVLDAASGDRLARRNAVVLGAAQALAGGNNSVLVATAGIVGSMLAPDKGLALLPVTVFVMSMWLSTLPMGWLARNFGRRDPIPIAFWDERFSTAAVNRALIANDVSRARRSEVVDKMAAAYILQGALDRLAGIAAARPLERN